MQCGITAGHTVVALKTYRIGEYKVRIGIIEFERQHGILGRLEIMPVVGLTGPPAKFHLILGFEQQILVEQLLQCRTQGLVAPNNDAIHYLVLPFAETTLVYTCRYIPAERTTRIANSERERHACIRDGVGMHAIRESDRRREQQFRGRIIGIERHPVIGKSERAVIIILCTHQPHPVVTGILIYGTEMVRARRHGSGNLKSGQCSHCCTVVARPERIAVNLLEHV